MTEHIAILQRCFLFRELSESDLNLIAHKIIIRQFKKGTQILTQDRPGNSLFIIVSGIAKVVMHGGAGRKKALAYLASGDEFGEISTFSKSNCTASVTANTDLAALELPKEHLSELITTSPDFVYNIIQTLCDRIRETDMLVHDLAFKNLEGRVAAKIIQLAEKFGTKVEQGTYIGLAITHSELAELVGTSRETTTKIISALKKSGALVVEDNQIIIADEKKLRSWME